jgi:hypothetical protein
MGSSNEPRNRNERRVASKSKAQSENDLGIPLANPSRVAPKHKTLFEIAAEKQAELQGSQQSSSEKSAVHEDVSISRFGIDSSGKLIATKDHPDGADVIGPFGEAVFYTISLSMLHFTLDVLVHQQYRQSIDWGMIIQRTATTVPILGILVYFLHSRSAKLWIQALFLGISIAAGCYMIYASNEEAYFAVMKRAPPLGTLWVWSVMEMRLELAVMSVGAAGAYFWLGGYSMF